MSAMQIGGSQKMSQVDQGPVWTTDSKCDDFLEYFPLIIIIITCYHRIRHT